MYLSYFFIKRLRVHLLIMRKRIRFQYIRKVSKGYIHLLYFSLFYLKITKMLYIWGRMEYFYWIYMRYIYPQLAKTTGDVGCHICEGKSHRQIPQTSTATHDTRSTDLGLLQCSLTFTQQNGQRSYLNLGNWMFWMCMHGVRQKSDRAH